MKDEFKMPDVWPYEPTYEENTYYHRGKIIAHFAMFERRLESFLSAEFSAESKDGSKIQSIIFDRMTFDSKRASVKTVLLRREEEKGFVKTKNNSHPYKKFLEELAALNNIRNQFAHYPTMQATNKFEYSHVIGLVEYRDMPSSKWYTQTDIDGIIVRIAAAQKEISSLAKKRNPSKGLGNL